MRFIDSFLNKITMYKLVLYGLTAITVAAFGLSVIGLLSYSPLMMAASLLVLLVVCYGANHILSVLYKAPTNVESATITALILFLTLAPIVTGVNIFYIAAAGALAMISKYVVAYKKRHIFNPAAFGLFALSLAGVGLATWWVASAVLLPIVLVVGLLVVRKIRRFDTFVPFLLVGSLIYISRSLLDGASFSEAVSLLFLSGPIIFMGTIMLTEPFTLPPSRKLRVVYAVLVGTLFASHFSLGPLYATPHLALLLGNIYTCIVGSQQRLMLTLRKRVTVASGTYEFVFTSTEPLRFDAGQYLEWTLPHQKPDSRGNRRYLSISSAPHTEDIRFATRITENSSSFKKALLNLPEGGALSAASLAGDFTLPQDTSIPIACIAGGIGITPFMSMVRDQVRTRTKRSITLLYAANTVNDLAFTNELDTARELGVVPVYVTGARITAETVSTHVPQYKTTHFYISGPDMMVQANKKILLAMGVPLQHIKTDYFPGL